MQAAAENLTPVTLELGGKSPCILGEDAVLSSAVESIVYGKLLNAGQTCIAPDYVMLPEHALDEFVGLATRTVQKFYPTLARNPDYSSIVNERHYRRIAQYVAEAKSSGARVIEINPAQEILTAETRKLVPILVIEPGDDLSVMREEIFEPVLPIKTYRGLDQAIDYVNNHPRPLALYYFGTNTDKRDEVLRRTIQAAPRSIRRRFISRPRICRSAAWVLRGSAPTRRVWIPDLLAPQGSVPAEPPQRLAVSIRRSGALPT